MTVLPACPEIQDAGKRCLSRSKPSALLSFRLVALPLCEVEEQPPLASVLLWIAHGHGRLLPLVSGCGQAAGGHAVALYTVLRNSNVGCCCVSFFKNP